MLNVHGTPEAISTMKAIKTMGFIQAPMTVTTKHHRENKIESQRSNSKVKLQQRNTNGPGNNLRSP